MSLKIGLIIAQSKHEAFGIADDVEAWLRASGVTVVSESEMLAGASADMLITLGGDGLIMRMAHVFPGVPILGINVGKVGFLARIERDDWQRALSELVARRYRIQDGPTLNATLTRDGVSINTSLAINDVVIRSRMQMVDVELYIDQQFVNTYPGDGMIVATPQGSTAYCMAAGGPVLDAGVRGFAVTPICAHSPIRTTLVVPEDATLELVIANDHEADLILDGAPVTALQQGDLVRVQKGRQSFHLVVLSGMNFYEAFRSKFNFRIRPNAIPTRPDLGVTPS
ncbi:MAG TPA: NAD(+)/NADH kinase [Nitrolancea sp.]|nr:NAD(+)/NADH kinase [Nitrolancea sp.]